MKTQLKLAALVLALSTINNQLSICFAQGSLTPPGAPAPTMRTLDQVYARGEARTPIDSAPITISSPGSYYLTTNLTVSSGTAITIATNGVTVDLNGFTIRSTAGSAAGYGILLSGTRRNIAIANGFIEGGVTNNGGVFSGSGFGSGIYYTGSVLANVLVSRVSVAGILNSGIYLGLGDSTIVESCTVRTVGGFGIYASTIKQSSAMDCGNSAIYGNQVSDCRGEAISSGRGVSATIAQNCIGYSSSGYGVYASRTAVGCYGSSVTGTGLFAQNAATCTGYRPGGLAILASIANGCCAAEGTNSITHKYNMP